MNNVLRNILRHDANEEVLLDFIKEFMDDETTAFDMPKKANIIDHLVSLNDAHTKKAVLSRLVDHLKQTAIKSREQKEQ